MFQQVIGAKGVLLAAECQAHAGLHIESPVESRRDVHRGRVVWLRSYNRQGSKAAGTCRGESRRCRACALTGYNAICFAQSERGGIGRRTGFRFQRWQHRESSSLSVRTIENKELLEAANPKAFTTKQITKQITARGSAWTGRLTLVGMEAERAAFSRGALRSSASARRLGPLPTVGAQARRVASACLWRP